MLLKPWERTLSSRALVVRGWPHEVSSGMASRLLPRFQPGCIAATAAIASPGTGAAAASGRASSPNVPKTVP
jgi:hypothetical protein